MSVANHDPDFDLAKGSHQVVLTLRIDSNDLNLEGKGVSESSCRNPDFTSATKIIRRLRVKFNFSKQNEKLNIRSNLLLYSRNKIISILYNVKSYITVVRTSARVRVS